MSSSAKTGAKGRSSSKKKGTDAGFILDQNLMGQMAPSYKNQWVILKMYGSLDLTQHNV